MTAKARRPTCAGRTARDPPRARTRPTPTWLPAFNGYERIGVASGVGSSSWFRQRTPEVNRSLATPAVAPGAETGFETPEPNDRRPAPRPIRGPGIGRQRPDRQARKLARSTPPKAGSRLRRGDQPLSQAEELTRKPPPGRACASQRHRERPCIPRQAADTAMRGRPQAAYDADSNATDKLAKLTWGQTSRPATTKQPRVSGISEFERRDAATSPACNQQPAGAAAILADAEAA